jgi:hypothetical protein
MVIGATQNLVPNAVTSGRYPPEGARSVKVTVDFSQGSSQIIDLVMMLQRLGMSCVQAAFINNANGSDAVTIRAATTGQEQTIAAGAQGWVNFLSPDFDTLTVTSAGTDTVDFHLLNFPVTPHVWGTSGPVPPGLYVLRAGDTMTGPLQVPAGSVTAPGLQVGASDTGIFSSANGRLDLSVGGITGWSVLNNSTTAVIHAYRSGQLGIQYQSDLAQVNRHEQYVNTTAGPTYQFRKARGTTAAPSVIQTNDVCGSLFFQGYNGTAFANVCVFSVQCIDPAPGVNEMEGRFTVSPALPSGPVSEVLRLEHSTGFSMFGANPVIDQNRLHKLRVYTVATLPAPAVAGAGATAYVSNALAPAWGVAVAGGGAVGVPVYCDGAAWYAG